MQQRSGAFKEHLQHLHVQSKVVFDRFVLQHTWIMKHYSKTKWLSVQAQVGTRQDRTAQDRAAQHRAAQHSTAQHSTAQHSTAQTDLYGSAKKRQLVEVESKAAADEAQAMMQEEGNTANSTIEDQCEYGVVDKVAIHDAAPEKVTICKHHQQSAYKWVKACNKKPHSLPGRRE